MTLQPGIVGDASPTGRQTYRHWLSRRWDSAAPLALVIGINPNTATESEDDPTTRFLIKLLRPLDGESR
jgi:hypothetical protein